MSSGSPRQVLFVNTDQLRADVLGCHGYPLAVTPNIDRLAAGGAVFRNCFTQSPVCTPARYSLLSGQYVETTGVMGNGPRGPRPEVTSLIDRFGAAGYHTTALGKLHHVPWDSPFGFQEVVLHDGGLTGRIQQSAYYQHLDRLGYLDLRAARPLEIVAGPADMATDPLKAKCSHRVRWGTSQLPPELQDSAWLADTTLRYLDDWQAEQPLFLYVSFVAPHSPYLASEPWDRLVDPASIPLPEGMFEEDLSDKGPGLRAKAAWYGDIFDEATVRAIRAAYLGVVAELDHHIGRVVDAFTARFGDDCIIVLTSDHGDFLGEHNLCEKHFHHDTADRVPCILAAPGLVAPGKTVAAQVEQIDLLPSVLELLDVPWDRQAVAGQAIDVAAVNADHFPGKPYVFSQIQAYGQYSGMVRGDRLKLIAVADLETQQVSWELYDLVNDPWERHNVIGAAAHAAGERELRDALLDWTVRLHAIHL